MYRLAKPKETDLSNINSQSKDVVINTQIGSPSIIQFHIKDTLPSYSNDEFIFLRLWTDTIVNNLKGALVDTIIFQNRYGESIYDYKYSKNGQTFSSPGPIKV